MSTKKSSEQSGSGGGHSSGASASGGLVQNNNAPGIRISNVPSAARFPRAEPKYAFGSPFGNNDHEILLTPVATPVPLDRIPPALALPPALRRTTGFLGKCAYKYRTWKMKKDEEITLFVSIYHPDANILPQLKSALPFDVALGIYPARLPIKYSILMQADGRVEEIPKEELEQSAGEQEGAKLVSWGPSGPPYFNRDPIKNARLNFKPRVLHYKVPWKGEPLARVAVARVKDLEVDELIACLKEIPVNAADGGNSGWMWIFHALRHMKWCSEDASLHFTAKLCKQLDAPGKTGRDKLEYWRDYLWYEGLLGEAYELKKQPLLFRNFRFS